MINVTVQSIVTVQKLTKQLMRTATRLTLAAVLSFPGVTGAQSITDTLIHIPDVVVNASRTDHFRHDVKTEEFRDSILNQYAGESLVRLLSGQTALNIKAYGVGGGASSISIRGASASQVQVNWNGFPINSVTLGSSDISMIPAAGFDRISLVYGASGALYGSGTFGGAVSLNSELTPERGISGSAYIGAQSLRALNGGFTFKAGSDRLAWKVFAWGTVSENEFTYYDYIRQTEHRQTDGDWHDYGMIHNLAFRLSSASLLEAGLWYQEKEYDIPSRIGSTTYEQQSDSTLKLYLGYRYIGKRWSLKVRAARFDDLQTYWQKPAPDSPVNSIDSRIAALQHHGDINFRYYMPSGLSFDAGLTGSMVTADVSAYGDKKLEKGIALFTGLKYTFDRLTLQSALRKEWFNTFSSGLLPSFGLKWDAIPGQWVLRANYSKKFRKPTFNDLFWIPGGNPDLNPENGYTIEAGSENSFHVSEKSVIETDITPYYTHVNDMIVWRPGGAYWSPKNYQEVRSVGIDLSAGFTMKHEKIKFSSMLKVGLNHSVANEEDGQEKLTMLYSPLFVSSWKNSLTAGIFDLEVTHGFTSARHYSDDRLLDPYNLIDIRAGVNIKAGKGKIGMHLSCNNVTNTTYELIKLYPMPGRYWSAKINYEF
ncbi:MAG: Vitamin B12 transporter BtuB precursor [Bacteroidetes bacterium ADurb.BinA012]|nr:MAG: Vitamin B12 transporter BtuB precursor [Bacteroidetes bacterium ADurb.BinA012]